MLYERLELACVVWHDNNGLILLCEQLDFVCQFELRH